MNILKRARVNSEKQRPANAAWWSAVMWIISGLYLFGTAPGTSLFSVKALLFFVPGLALASLCFGIVFYFVQRAAAQLFVRLARDSRATFAAVASLGAVLLIVQACLVYLSARQMFRIFVQ